jgi:formylglycine-generating enzyme required for sulfatase activity
MKRFIALLLITLIFPAIALASRGIGVVPFNDKSGKQVGLYKESHALVIGVSDYTAGWPDLPGVKKDVRLVKEALENAGFNVVVKQDLDRRGLEDAFNDFINQYGHNPDARLLFYFAGHGHTMKLAYGGDMGYIIPTNAPNPNRDEKGFLAKAMDMEMIEVYAKRIQSKHAMFLFDSCFSGSIFALTRAVPENINYKTSKPVRQFITAGSAEEKVPDESIFRSQFIAALQGEGDTDKDGYVTGVELGEFLQNKVINYSHGSQHPQYGKIQNPHLDKGDFVFPLKTASLTPESSSILTPPPAIPAPPTAVILKGHLQVNVNAPNSQIRINGENKGSASPGRPLNLQNLPTGNMSVHVDAEGFESLQKTVTLNRNKWTQEVFELSRAKVVMLDRPAPAKALTSDQCPNKMSFIPGGVFLAGKVDSLKEMNINAFCIDQYEVTQAEYEQTIGNNPSEFNNELFGKKTSGLLGIDSENPFMVLGNVTTGLLLGANAKHPVETVTWNEAKEYCKQGGKRLPTEWEWEKAAKAGTRTKYYWGNEMRNNKANCLKCGSQWDNTQTAPVGSFAANSFGLFDMAGNVEEWTDSDYEQGGKVLRGGSWGYDPYSIRSAYRHKKDLTASNGYIGFRCAK